MSTATETPRDIGRRAAEWARIHDCHPNSIIRHIRKGVMLRNGARLKLRATSLPGGYRVTDEDMREFLDALTRDRLGEAAVTSAPSKSSIEADAVLSANGW